MPSAAFWYEMASKEVMWRGLNNGLQEENYAKVTNES